MRPEIRCCGSGVPHAHHLVGEHVVNKNTRRCFRGGGATELVRVVDSHERGGHACNDARAVRRIET